jgi:hypothetical protein
VHSGAPENGRCYTDDLLWRTSKLHFQDGADPLSYGSSEAILTSGKNFSIPSHPCSLVFSSIVTQ